MAGEAAALTRLSRLRLELAVDAQALEVRFSETKALVERQRAIGQLPRPELVLLAVNLHGYFTALETLLERVGRLMDGDVPTGPAWHQELLDQMRIEIPGLRPAVIPAALIPDLNELRRFRHFFRNAYSLELDPAKVFAQAERLTTVHLPLEASLGAFQRHVDAVIAELAGA